MAEHYDSDASSFGFTCLITGVTLFDRDSGRCKPADLFQHGSALVVNAAGNWKVRTPRAHEKCFEFDAYRSVYFTRRNVYVFVALRLEEYLNTPALQYVNKGVASCPTSNSPL